MLFQSFCVTFPILSHYFCSDLHITDNVTDALCHIRINTYSACTQAFWHNCLIKVQTDQIDIRMLFRKLLKRKPDDRWCVKANP